MKINRQKGVAAPLLVILVLSIIGGAVYFESQYNFVELDLTRDNNAIDTIIEQDSEQVLSDTNVPDPTGGVSQVENTVNASLTLISPNGGEELVLGDVVPLQWSSAGIPADATINVYLTDIPAQRYGAPNDTIGLFLGETKNTGNTKLLMPRIGFADGGAWYDFATLRIEWDEHSEIQDKSNAEFRLERDSFGSPYSLTHDVTLPVAGDTFYLGDSVTVAWNIDDYYNESQEWMNFRDTGGAVITLSPVEPCPNYGWSLGVADNDGMETVVLDHPGLNEPPLKTMVEDRGCSEYTIRVSFGTQISSQGESAVFTILPEIK